MSLMTTKLRQLRIINCSFPDQLIKSLCYENILQEKCLARSCTKCKELDIVVNDFDPEKLITHKQWNSKTVKVLIKNEERECKKAIKEDIQNTAVELLCKLKTNLPKFMQHVLNINHQYKAIDEIKKNISFQEALVHIDFSENYGCKCAAEVQSAHFGSSKPQISLNTVVFYYRCPLTNSVKHVSCCSLSKELRHDPAAICAHLVPIFKLLKEKVKNLRTINFLSDGPKTQFKNKKMFYLICTFIAKTLEVGSLSWHYSESGHGKGTLEGIGGVVKRTADRIVALGKDVSDFDVLVETLGKYIKSVQIITINEADIVYFDALLLQADLKVFKRTLKIHELFWIKSDPSRIESRSLTCTDCSNIINCSHYYLGHIELKEKLMVDSDVDSNLDVPYTLKTDKMRISDVYGSSSKDENKENISLNDQIMELEENSFYIVQFFGRDRVVHYIGQVIYHDKTTDELKIKFMRRKGKINEDIRFAFPYKDDISLVDKKDIVLRLRNPGVKRGQYFFEDTELEKILNLQ